MKKNRILILIGLLLLLVGCTNSNSNLKDLSYSDLNKKLESKEEFFFVVTQDGCSHCENFIPVLTKTLNSQKVIGYNLNLSKLSSEEKSKFDEAFNIEGTPTTIFIKDGKELSIMQRIVGSLDKDKLIQKFKNNGYIK